MTLDTIMDLLPAAAGNLTEAVETIVDALFEEGLTPDAKDLAKALNDLSKEGHGNWGGWNLHTRIEYEQCVGCWFGLSTKWKKMPPTAWQEYGKGGLDGKGTFETKIDAYRAAKKACAEHLKTYNSAPK